MIVELLGKREIWLVGFTYLALSSAMRGLLVWLPTFLVEKMGITLVAASSLAGLLSLPGIPSMFVGTWISDVKLQGRKSAVIAASLLGSIPILLLLSLIKEQVQLLWLLALLYALFYSSAGLYFAYPSALLPKEQVGAGSGLIDMLGYIGSFLGTMVTGVAIDTFNSYDSMFLILAGATLIGALAIAKVKP
jgi:sugar phosphate permease